MNDRLDIAQGAFAEESERLRASGVFGVSGRLLDLFDYLAERGAEAVPASQAEIAIAVLDQRGTDSDDATVRVYIHRLRKRLEDFYSNDEDDAGHGMITLPVGIYALRQSSARVRSPVRKHGRRALVGAIAIALLTAFFAGWLVHSKVPAAPVNVIWQPFLASERPIVIAVGDYYIFGEYDPQSPEVTRLVRDFNIDSPIDLARAQETDPERYSMTEDVGLNYLPVSSAYGLAELLPILRQGGKNVSIMPASAVTSDTFRKSNVIYVGLMSGMALLEEVSLTGSSFMIGASYDELIDTTAQRTYASEEAWSLASERYYKDYGYFAMFREPGGGLVAVVAGARDTGLKGLADVLGRSELPSELIELTRADGAPGYEALFEITGQQGADLNARLVAARTRP